MSVQAVEFYTVVCDECGVSADEFTDYSAWSTEEGALETFHEYINDGGDWSTFTPARGQERHRCPKHNPFCIACGKDAGELSGERDYLCHACFKLLEESA